MAKKGSKLVKSETVQVRFDPILKTAAELAAAKERRTLSSFTEMAVEQSVKQSYVIRDDSGEQISAWQVAQKCWNAEPGFRLGNLAKYYPDLLTIRERKITDARNLLLSSDAGMVFVALNASSELWTALCRYADDEISFEDLAVLANQIRLVLVKRMKDPSP